MFKKLRNKFIIVILSITAVIISISFTIIYFSITKNANQRPYIPEDAPSYTIDVQNIIATSIKLERVNASNELLSILIITGISIEVLVAIISYFFAESSIKPIKDAYQAQKIFIANASHEIKTPLAAISANLEAADLHDNKWIQNVEFETEKLTTLNNELLNLARINISENSQKKQNINIANLIKQEIKSAQPRLDAKKIKLTLNAPEETIQLNKKDFAEIFSILLDNAIKYSEKQINITFNQCELTIKNDGKIIPKSDIEHLFERFYQVDKSANGVGLGLSIAKSLAEHNNWQLNVKTDQSFNIFTLKL